VIGSGVNYAAFQQTDLLKDSSRRYSFVNYFPNVFLRLTPRAQRYINLRYNGRNNPPSLEQLQPVRENTDPLYIQLGNPGLRQEFVHNINISFNDYKILSQRGIYLVSYSNITQNAISNSTIVDAGGKTTNQPINVKGNYTTGFFGGYGMKLQKLDVHTGIDGEFNITHVSNRINNLNNVNDNKTFFLGTRVQKDKKDKYSYSVRPRVGYTFSRSSLRPDITTKYFTTETELSAWRKLPWKLEIWSAAYINTRQKTDVFDRNRNVVKWDANIVRKFLKKDNLELKFAVFDLLNQNIGFNRTATSNFISERSYISLQRYWMVGLQYNITKNP
jgi:hypothetical protein